MDVLPKTSHPSLSLLIPWSFKTKNGACDEFFFVELLISGGRNNGV